VYVPLKNDEIVNFDKLTIPQINRIYKFVSCTDKEAHFVPYSNSAEIVKNENGTNSKNERIQDFFDDNTILDEKGKLIQVKSVCWKLKVDRLGNISKS
jgi:CRISPR-associated endonuclease Csn1